MFPMALGCPFQNLATSSGVAVAILTTASTTTL